jgi:hypothetical protein
VKTTGYFENVILTIKRPYLEHHWCEQVRQSPVSTLVEEDTGRIRHWAYVAELDALGMPPDLRVVTLQIGETIHNAFPERNLTLQRRRSN